MQRAVLLAAAGAEWVPTLLQVECALGDAGLAQRPGLMFEQIDCGHYRCARCLSLLGASSPPTCSSFLPQAWRPV